MRLTLTYSALLSHENSWHLRGDHVSISARIRVASAPEYHVTIPLRRSGKTLASDERAFIRRLNGDQWLIAGAVHHPNLPRLELALSCVPEDVSALMSLIP